MGFSEQIKYLGMVFHAWYRDNTDVQKQVKSHYFVANKLRISTQCLAAVKSLFCFCCVSIHTC